MSQVALPASLAEVWHARAQVPGALFYAGGTDLLVRLRREGREAPDLVCLQRVAELRESGRRAGRVFLGAGLSHARLLAHPLVREHFPVLAAALRSLGSPLIRNLGTLGGNLATASPAGDTLPPLRVLEAEVELAAAAGSRRLPLADFLLGPGRTALAPGELIRGVWLDPPPPGTLQHFEKVGQRNALAIALVSLAAVIRRDAEGVVIKARLAWGSVAPTILACPAAEAALVGRPLDRASLSRAAELARAAARPIDDLRAPAEYRRTVAGNLLLRLAPFPPPGGAS